jgi:hypothetical protein
VIALGWVNGEFRRGQDGAEVDSKNLLAPPQKTHPSKRTFARRSGSINNGETWTNADQ